MKNTTNLFRVNTTAFSEEDFIILTNLTEEQIQKVLIPMVEKERNKDEDYDNDMLIEELKITYPKATIAMYYPDNLDLITI